MKQNLMAFLCILIALQHFFFLVLEMFLWTKPLGKKVFRMSEAKAKDSKVLAANQGLYNGFLFAGLIWSVIHTDPIFSEQLKIFFLSCVALAGLYGGYSVSRRILFIQALPAIVTLGLIFI